MCCLTLTAQDCTAPAPRRPPGRQAWYWFLDPAREYPGASRDEPLPRLAVPTLVRWVVAASGAAASGADGEGVSGGRERAGRGGAPGSRPSG